MSDSLPATLIISLFTALVFVSGTATAQDQFDDSGFYVGAGYGLISLEGDDFDEDDNAPHIFAGYQILPFLGIEAAYHNFGEYGNGLYSAEIESYSLALTGRLPLSRSLALFARVGPMWSETELRAGAFTADQDSEEILLGAGMEFEVADNIDLRLAYDWVDQDLDASELEGVGNGDFNADLNMLSAGIKFEF
jgi:opacity protein-like surface antigen